VPVRDLRYAPSTEGWLVGDDAQAPSFLLDALWPTPGLLRDVTLIVGGSVLVAVAAHVEIPLDPVPITGQTFAVLLIGALIGSARGALSLAAYLVQGMAGLPVFAGGVGGAAHVVGPTGGYLIGFVAAALVVGWLTERGWARRPVTAIVALAAGNAVIYLFGLTWLARFVPPGDVLELGLIPFVAGDVLKLVLAALVLPSGWALVNRLK
jgi:biotin transporter BioY